MSIATLQNTSGEYIRINIVPKNEYLYIGNNFEFVEDNLKTFDGGTIELTVEDAIQTLKRKKEYRTPSVFIFDETSESDLQQFHHFVLSTPRLQTIPTLLICNADADCTKYLDYKFVDEVIDIRYSDDIVKKAKVLTKAKQQQSVKTTRKPMDIDWFFKRGFDISFSLVCLILVAPVFLIIAVLIKLESKGPVFYISKRAGENFRIFNFLKFRTMEAGADKKVVELLGDNMYNKGNKALFFKLKNDPRVTKVGKFLRNTSLDELPQLINVLKGDMSLVGNRPLPLYEANTLTTDSYAGRFMAPAGITGLWQIKKRGQKHMSVEERINLDISYANRSSLIYDFWILANTPKALVQKESV